MGAYVLKRLLTCLLILLLVALTLYTLLRCLPTSYVESLARERADRPGGKSYTEQLAELKRLYGLDQGILPGFWGWLERALAGDFGESWHYGVPVTEKFSQVIWYSFALGGVAFLLEICTAIPLGILAARKQYSKTDYAVTIFALTGISLPTFFFATVLKLVFSVKLGWTELYGTVGRFYGQLTPWGKFLDLCRHFALPVVTLVIIGVGGLMRFTRTNMLEALRADYVRTARAKGIPERRVLFRHAFRNTLIPVITAVGGTLPGLFSGALITETLFGITGIGKTAYDAISAGDIPFSMFYMVFLAALTLLGTLISDLLYAVADPRVRIA